MNEQPKIEDIPGVKWRKFASGKWEARWVPRRDLVLRGYSTRAPQLWSGTIISEAEQAALQSEANRLQAEMLAWAQTQLPMPGTFDGTMSSLIQCYQTDPDSSFRKVEYATRHGYGRMLRRIDKTVGERVIKELKGRDFLRWYEKWSKDGLHKPTAHSLMSLCRTMFTFGMTLLNDKQCERCKTLLSGMKFQGAGRRTEIVTAEQVLLICEQAYLAGRQSMALAQAFQFCVMLRQKDVIGAWVPLAEPVPSDVIDGQWKWIKGIRWESIDAALKLRHVTSKRGKPLEVDLKLDEILMTELAAVPEHRRHGPVIIDEATGLPYRDKVYRDLWRQLARNAGIPDSVQTRDSRAGGATEAFALGADIDAVRQAMTHSQASTTMIYARGSAKQTAKVMELRNASRGTNGENPAPRTDVKQAG